MNKETYEKYFQGYSISNASILNKGRICFFLQKNQHGNEIQQPAEDLPSRVVLYTPDIRQEYDGFSAYNWNRGIKNAYVYINQYVVVAETFGKVWQSRTDDQWHKATIDSEKVGHWISGLKQIGQTLFACGNSRKVYRRDGFNQWVDLVDYEKHRYVYADIYDREKKGVKHFGYPMGFTCFDGFNEEDIYAGGTNGTFWRYNGKKWFSIDLQSKRDISDVVCAPNKKVYVVMSDGDIIIGRNDQWKSLGNEVDRSNSCAAGVSSAVWFQDKLYLATPFDLYVFDGKLFNKYKFPKNGHRQSSFGWVTACKESLLSYGSNQALVFDGENWTEIVSCF